MCRRSMLVAVATFMLGACQSPIRVEEVANEVIEQEPVEVVQSQSAPKATKTTYYDKSLFKLPLDHPYWSTTVLSSDTIEKLKEHYGFSELVANDVVIEEDQDSSNQVEGNLASAELVDDSSVTTSNSITKPNSNSTSNSTTKPNSNSTSNNTTKPNSNSTSNNTTKPNSNSTSNNTTKPNQNNQSSKPTPPVVEKPSTPAPQPTPPVVEKPSTPAPQPTPPVVEQPSEPAPQPTPPVVEQPSEPAPQPTPPVVEESKKPVDILDWNYIKSTLIAKGESLGMSLDTSLTRENQGYAFPWDSKMDIVSNEDVIGYIGYQMEECSNNGWEYYNLEMVVQPDGHVLIYLIR